MHARAEGNWLRTRGVGLGVLLGVVYGVALRFLFGPKLLGGTFQGDGLIMTAAFLVGGPLAVGYLTVRAAEQQRPGIGGGKWIFIPWVPILISTAIAGLLQIEGLICIVFALPITLLSASFGGAIAGVLARKARKRAGIFTTCIAVLPFLLGPVESRIDAPIRHRRVETKIAIQATPMRVWANIERVPRIEPSELPSGWTQSIGFPRPVEATLSFEGVGGVRHASFERGLLFIETVDRWEPNRLLSFSIRADSEHIPKTTLDEHVTIGGKYFDVLNGKYEIEPLASGGVILHLSSEERLSTDFNGYAGLWSDAVMRNIQENILLVVKRRSERAY